MKFIISKSNKMSNDANNTFKRVKKFWLAYETRIVLIFGFLAISVISFEIGLINGQKWQQKPIIIEKPMPVLESIQNNPSGVKEIASDQLNEVIREMSQPTDCAFVGSKNSDKYHVPTCQWAKRIKPENIICFKSIDDAVAKNYKPDKTCIK